MSTTAALFDMDHTLIWVNSGHSSIVLAKRMGLVSSSQLLTGIYKILLYRLSLLNINEWYETNISTLKGLSIEDMDSFADLWFNTMVKKHLYKEGLELINEHRRKGHRLAIVSNGPEFFVRALARALDVPEIISTRLEIKEGLLTGKLVKPLCYGEGKLRYTLSWAEENDIDLGSSYFYTDSNFDLPVMRFVGHPVAVNPDFRLRRHARINGWPILNFKKISAF
jgi:HAD superfamily hydrolase (TIGR01490 family)